MYKYKCVEKCISAKTITHILKIMVTLQSAIKKKLDISIALMNTLAASHRHHEKYPLLQTNLLLQIINVGTASIPAPQAKCPN